MLWGQACKPAAQHNPQPAFYYWQTAFSISKREQAVLDSLHVRRLYVKYFDIAWEAPYGPVPLAEVQWVDAPPDNVEVVPTLFITNEVMRNLTDQTAADSLTANLWAKLQALHPARPLHEIQLDCDWTTSTRQTYFAWLRTLRAVLPDTIALSATIRLHQLRYPQQTGVPPVDRGMLMFYNMGNVSDWDEPNSILDLDTAATYLSAPAYPLPLDLALPIYRWGVLYRNGRMTRLLNDLTAAELEDTSRFARLADNRYELRQSTYLGGYYAYQGDLIRLEAITPAALRASRELLKNTRPEQWGYLSFYHLEETLFDAIAAKDLEEICKDW